MIIPIQTSALDTHSEGIVQDALNKASVGRTVIAVAHRISTIQHAHCIFVLGEGQLIEQGTHAELLRNEQGAYAQLVLGQRLREAQEKDGLEVKDSKGVSRSVTPLPSVGGSEEIETEIGTKVRAEKLPYVEELKGRTKPTTSVGETKREYSGWELFKRMAKINQDVRNVYLLGIVAAIGAFSVAFARLPLLTRSMYQLWA